MEVWCLKAYKLSVRAIVLLTTAALLITRFWQPAQRLGGYDVVDAKAVHRLQSSSLAGSRLLVDVNSADVEQLQGIKGVGPALAEAIVKHRSENGLFASVDDLIEVRGIGAASLERMRPYCYVGNAD